MSPKFGLAFLLLCFVLLGLSDAQRHQGEYRVKGQYQSRNTGGGVGLESTDGGVGGGKVDCNQNTLASGNKDRFTAGH